MKIILLNRNDKSLEALRKVEADNQADRKWRNSLLEQSRNVAREREELFQRFAANPTEAGAKEIADKIVATETDSGFHGSRSQLYADAAFTFRRLYEISGDAIVDRIFKRSQGPAKSALQAAQRKLQTDLDNAIEKQHAAARTMGVEISEIPSAARTALEDVLSTCSNYLKDVSTSPQSCQQAVAWLLSDETEAQAGIVQLNAIAA